VAIKAKRFEQNKTKPVKAKGRAAASHEPHAKAQKPIGDDLMDFDE
jgi:hypothetical protein